MINILEIFLDGPVESFFFRLGLLYLIVRYEEWTVLWWVVAPFTHRSKAPSRIHGSDYLSQDLWPQHDRFKKAPAWQAGGSMVFFLSHEMHKGHPNPLPKWIQRLSASTIDVTWPMIQITKKKSKSYGPSLPYVPSKNVFPDIFLGRKKPLPTQTKTVSRTSTRPQPNPSTHQALASLLP